MDNTAERIAQHIRSELDHGFELIGGDVSTDFTNTRSGRYEVAGHEHVQTYADLVEFARLSGLLPAADAARLVREAVRHPEKATQIHRRAVLLREAIWRAFARIASGKEPPREDVDLISREAAEALRHARVTPSGGGFEWTWAETTDLARPVWPIARAAADLLTNDADRANLRECADDTCAWLFVDRTKNHSRRWCDMNNCGTRNKVRAYRTRQKRAARDGVRGRGRT